MRTYRNDKGLTVQSDIALDWEGWQEEAPARPAPVARKKTEVAPAQQSEPEEAELVEVQMEQKTAKTAEQKPAGNGAVIRPKKGK